jgi:hypothetical protein
MTEDSSFLQTRHGAAHEMQIGAADSAGGQTNDGVELVLYGRLLDVVESDVSSSMENNGCRGFSPGSSFCGSGLIRGLAAGDLGHEERLCLATFAPCFPSAVRTDFGKWAMVRLRLADCAAFLMFFRAAFLCLSLAMTTSRFGDSFPKRAATRKRHSV